MVPFGLTKVQFLTKYRGYLDRASRDAIRALRAVFVLSVPPAVKSAEVEIFLDEDGAGAPSVWMYFNGLHSKVDHLDPSIFPGRSMELALGLKAPPDFDERYFDSDLFDGLSFAADTVRDWFAECWWKAGGWSYSLPVNLSVHDQIGDGESVVLSEVPSN